MKQIEDEILTSNLLITNARPMLSRMQELLNTCGCTSPGGMKHEDLLRYEACLWALMVQVYSSPVDLAQTYTRLREQFIRRGMIGATEGVL